MRTAQEATAWNVQAATVIFQLDDSLHLALLFDFHVDFEALVEAEFLLASLDRLSKAHLFSDLAEFVELIRGECVEVLVYLLQALFDLVLRLVIFALLFGHQVQAGIVARANRDASLAV